MREIETAGLGTANPSGLAYSPQANLFQVIDGKAKGAANPTVVEMTPVEDQAGTPTIADTVSDPINAAFNARTNSLYLLNQAANSLNQIPADANGKLPPSASVSARFDSGPYGIQNSQGMTFNPADGRLYILDPAGKRMIRILPDANGGYDGKTAVSEGRLERIDLKHLGANHLKGIAFNPADGHLYVLGPAEKRLFKITETGQQVETWDLSAFSLADPQGMVFAPSGDLTDDASIQGLFIADTGQVNGNNSQPGKILELSLTAPAVQTAPVAITASLVRTIRTSSWSPPSPDPAGLDFRPNGRMLVSDSEVEEMSIYKGKNVFEATSAGSLRATCDTTAFSKEPTGVAVNLGNGHIFFSNDDQDRIYEINLGPDGQYCTSDDTRTFIGTRAFNSTDPEGIGFGEGKLFISDGLNKEIYVVNLGSNGVLDGSDSVSHFDTAVMGLRDPEGIGYHAQRGTVFIVSRVDNKLLVEASPSGSFLSSINISSANPKNMAGLGCGPGSQNSNVTNIFIADRGVDNNKDPNENDGKIYEISIGG